MTSRERAGRDGMAVVNQDAMQAWVDRFVAAWASREPRVMARLWEWACTGTVNGTFMEWEGVDRMVLRGARIAEEVVFHDTYPLRRALDPTLPEAPLVRVADLA